MFLVKIDAIFEVFSACTNLVNSLRSDIAPISATELLRSVVLYKRGQVTSRQQLKFAFRSIFRC